MKKIIFSIIAYMISMIFVSCDGFNSSENYQQSSIIEEVIPVRSVPQGPPTIVGEWELVEWIEWNPDKTSWTDWPTKNIYGESLTYTFNEDGLCVLLNDHTTYSVEGDYIVLATGDKLHILELTHDRLKYSEKKSYGDEVEKTFKRVN